MKYEKLDDRTREVIREAHPRAVFLASPEPDFPDFALRRLRTSEVKHLAAVLRKSSESEVAQAFEEAVDAMLPSLLVWPDDAAKLLEECGDAYAPALGLASVIATEATADHYPKDRSWPSLSRAPSSSTQPSGMSASPPTATSPSSEGTPSP